MITTNDDEMGTLCRSLRDHGASKTDLDRHNQKFSFLLAEYKNLGFNFRMTDIQGAMGVAQMMKANKIMKSRRESAARYDELLKDVDWLRIPFKHPDYKHGYQSYVCYFEPEKANMDNWEEYHNKRNEIMFNLEEKGIITRQGTHAVAHLELYREKYGISPRDFPEAFLAELLSITLPLFAGMTEDESETVVKELKSQYAD